MQKLLMVAGSKGFSAATLDFGCYLAHLSDSPLTGIFVRDDEDVIFTSDQLSRQAVGTATVETELLKTSYDHCTRLLTAFKEGCTARDVSTEAEHQFAAWSGLMEVARFSDLVILDAEFGRHADVSGTFPSSDAKRLLHGAECPVVIAPLHFAQLDEIIFAYDGSRSSLHAIKQFCYLFPQLGNLQAELLQVVPENGTQAGVHWLKKWMEGRFRKVNTVVMDGDVASSLIEYLFLHPHSISVMGGFGRNRFSRLLQKSTSGEIARFISSALFIAHC